MKGKTVASLIAIVVIASVVMFVGCVEETPTKVEEPATTPQKPTPGETTPPSSFKIEQPITVYFEPHEGFHQVTLYEDSSAFIECLDDDPREVFGECLKRGGSREECFIKHNFYGEWTIDDETPVRIDYEISFTVGLGQSYSGLSKGKYSGNIVIYSNHDAIDPDLAAPGYWE